MLHPNFVYMTRGMQCGQVVAIGRIAGETFPQVRIGDTLLVHHFVESSEKTNCIAQDEYFNYYIVTCISHNGQNNQTYAVFDGSKIIPHPDYLFLETLQPRTSSQTPEEYLDAQLTMNDSGLLTFKQWTVDREGIVKQIQDIKRYIEELTKPGMQMTSQVAKVVEEKEAEMNHLSSLLNKKRFELYTIAAINPDFAADVHAQFLLPVKKGDDIYMLNIACDTKMEFQQKEYIVAKAIHFGAPRSWVTHQFNKESASLSC